MALDSGVIAKAEADAVLFKNSRREGW